MSVDHYSEALSGAARTTMAIHSWFAATTFGTAMTTWSSPSQNDMLEVLRYRERRDVVEEICGLVGQGHDEFAESMGERWRHDPNNATAEDLCAWIEGDIDSLNEYADCYNACGLGMAMFQPIRFDNEDGFFGSNTRCRMHTALMELMLERTSTTYGHRDDMGGNDPRSDVHRIAESMNLLENVSLEDALLRNGRNNVLEECSNYGGAMMGTMPDLFAPITGEVVVR